MKFRIILAAIFSTMLWSCNGSGGDSNTKQSDYQITPVEFNQVVVNDQFWAPRIRLNKDVTIPSSLQKCDETGRIENFRVAAGLSEGVFKGVFPFDDSDVYKIIEGASYSLTTNPDPALSSYLDTIISYIAAAQEPDGYLHTWRTIDPTKPPTTWSGNEERWSDIGGGHELYNMGHFYEAAVAHYRATGKTNMLDIATKNAQLILATFGPGKMSLPPGHQEIELGLVKLYRVTGNGDYLELAKFFLDQRGNSEGRDGLYGPYSQDHVPVQQQAEAVGHAVRAGYMYAAMADVAAMTGDTAYMNALDNIWDNVTGKKIYLTGGIGSRHGGEAFGENYELPNFTAYNETCAAIANIYWNHRMFLMTGEGKYMDVLERTLYNGMIAGVSLSGDHFFYPNPLASDGISTFNMGSCERSPWFDCSCCPSNVTRFIPSVPGYVYATRNNQLYVNLFIGNNATMEVAGKKVAISQSTEYPWEGKVKIELSPAKPLPFDLKIRIPGWAQGEVMAGDLYRYLDNLAGTITLSVNGVNEKLIVEEGYALISREWKKGDVVELSLPMEARRVAANDSVVEDRGKMAVECGPIVYCAEEADNGFDIFSVTALPEQPAFTREFNRELLGGITSITANALVAREGEGGIEESQVKMIPYYAWNNRGAGKMTVWFPAR